MAGKDFFSPPTAQEIAAAKADSQMFAPPSMDELKQFSPAPPPQPESWGKQLARSTIDTVIPTIGMIGGAAAGLPLAPETFGASSVAAAGAGYAGGKSLANYLKGQFLGDDPQAKTLGDLAKQTIGDTRDGMMMEMGGQILSATPGLVKKGIESGKNLVSEKLGQNLQYTPSPNAGAVTQAAETLGIPKLPKALLTDNPNYQKLESGLAQSGSLPARGVKQTYADFFKGLDKAKAQISDLKSADSDFSIGKSIQDDLSNQVKKAKEPVKELYDSVTGDLKNIPVNKSVVNRAMGDLKRNPIFQTKDGQAFLAEHKDLISGTPDLASLKELRSTYSKMTGPSAAPIEEMRVNAVRDAVTKIRDASIQEMKTDLPKSAHAQVDELANQIALADSAHASNISDINSVKSLVGNKDFSSPSGFLNKLGDVKESDLAQKAANLDVKSLQNLKEKFPSVFEKAKTAKVNDLIQSSTHPVNGFNDASFMKKYDGLDKEAKDLLFPSDVQKKIEALRTVRQAIPDKLGPSGTPEGLMTMDMISPRRNALDLGIKMTLDHAEKSAAPQLATAASSAPSKVTPLLRLISGDGRGSGQSQSLMTPMPKAADQQKPQDAKPAQAQPLKGTDKWANDGLEKLQDHTDDNSSEDDSSLFDDKEAMLSNPKIKSLLIQASDLKPGSRAMANMAMKIKSQLEKANA